MRLFFKIVFLPVWLPFKILWLLSKTIALFIMLLLLTAVIVLVLSHM
jgi:hypothetical protein